MNFNARTIQIVGKGGKIRFVTMNDRMKNAIDEYMSDREKLLNSRKNNFLFVTNKTANTGKAVLKKI